MNFDQEFITYCSDWVATLFVACESVEELEYIANTITIKLKSHLANVDLPQFLHLTHCEDTKSEEEKFQAAKRYEEHINHACALTLAVYIQQIHDFQSTKCEEEE